MYVSKAELFESYQSSEEEKGVPFLGFPLELSFARSVLFRQIGVAELSQLQLTVEPKLINGQYNPTFKIFKLLKTSNALQIAKELDQLRSSDDLSIRQWVSTINQSLSERIMEKSCPPIITSKRLLHRGDVPDGNHRALAAIELSLMGEDPVVSTYEVDLGYLRYLFLNAVVYLDRFKSNPQGTIAVSRERVSK